jgi:hypothetical protein
MINDLDETIKQLLIKKGGLDSGTVDISFEVPDREWSASISKPRVNIYLYDIRENHELRGTDWIVTKEPNGSTSRKKTPSRIDLAYLITVWANDVADEHRLLWQIMSTLFRYPIVPQDILKGDLAKQEYPILTTTAQPDGLFNNPADFWSALDNEIKPSINYVLTLALDLDMVFRAPLVTSKSMDIHAPDGNQEKLVEVSGIIREAGKTNKAVAKARIVAKEAGMSALSDEDGRYTFPRIGNGKHIFQVFVPGKKVQESEVTVPDKNYDLEI